MSVYKIDEKSYPSVTTVLGILDKSAALMPWAVNCAVSYIEERVTDIEALPETLKLARKEWREVSKEAMDIGSEIHSLIEVYIKEGKDAVGEMRPEVENGFLAFLEWESENIEKWLESEMTVSDDIYCVAGTLDAVAKMKDGRVLVIDFKSSKGFYDGYAEQLAAYRYCYETMKHKVVDGQGVLRLDKATGEPEWKDYTDGHQRALDTFKAVLDVYYLQKNRRLKDNPIVKQMKERYNAK